MIDKKAAVGRIVIRSSDAPNKWIDPEWTGRITLIQGERIQFDRRLGDGKTESRFLLMKKVAYVCDTEAELTGLLKIQGLVDLDFNVARDAAQKAFDGLLGKEFK